MPEIGDAEVPLSEVEQLESDRGVLVRNAGPIETRELPTRPGGMLNTSVTFQQPESLAGHDPRRKRLHVLACDFDVMLGLTRAEVVAGTGFYLPAGKELEVGHIGQVYAAAAKTGETARVSYCIDLWA